MKFEEYLQTEEYWNVRSKGRASKQKNRVDFIIALAFLGLALLALLVINVVPDSVKGESWFLSTVISVTLACYVGAGVLELVFFLRGHRSRANFLDPEVGAGVLFQLRELPFELKSGIQNSNLTVPVCYRVDGGIVKSISYGKNGEIDLDLSPWNGAEFSGVIGFAALPVLDFLMNEDLYSLSLVSVGILPSASDGTVRSEGKPIALVKKGRWTFTGKLLRGDYKRCVKFAQKISEGKQQ